MGIVLVHVTMSLDGFIAGPGDAMDWVFEHAGAANPPNEEAGEVFHSTGAVLGGRRTFEVGRKPKRPEIS